MAANPTTRPSSIATSTRNFASGGLAIACAHDSVMLARSTDASTCSATSVGNSCCQLRRWIAAIRSASAGRARRQESGVRGASVTPTC